jgi:succinate dehydrogenase / fumarate reductase flavoprotein subunit
VLLDLRHLGAHKINERLPLIREVTIKFNNIDPIDQPIPVRPAAHYSMGGIHVNIDGASPVEGIWVAGEAACVSLHGANRLGTNSTAECLVWGKITGQNAARYTMAGKARPDVPIDRARAEENRMMHELFQKKGTESIYAIRQELRDIMDSHVGIYRTEEGLQAARQKVKELKQRFQHTSLKDKGMVYNTDLVSYLETENMLDLAEVIVESALARKESRGGHFRRDYPQRDDQNWLKHTLAYHTGQRPRLEYIPVSITTWKPVERKY